jgi:hypothetical protein
MSGLRSGQSQPGEHNLPIAISEPDDGVSGSACASRKKGKKKKEKSTGLTKARYNAL